MQDSSLWDISIFRMLTAGSSGTAPRREKAWGFPLHLSKHGVFIGNGGISGLVESRKHNAGESCDCGITPWWQIHPSWSRFSIKRIECHFENHLVSVYAFSFEFHLFFIL
jgi:hypothetical protein